jgi:hypothetical protein
MSERLLPQGDEMTSQQLSGTTALAETRKQLGSGFTPEAADAADPVVAGQLIVTYQPRALVLNAGAAHAYQLSAAGLTPAP